MNTFYDWLHTVAITTHRTGFRWQARREIARLRRHGGALETRLADVLAATLHEQLSEEEAAWIQRIEDLRTQLRASPALVSFVDYGVPSRVKGATAEEGVVVTRAVSEVCKASAPAHEARVLFHLIRTFRPVRCLELGTCLGLSAAYQAAALKLNGAGHLVSLEGGAALAILARNHLADLGLDHAEIITGRFQDTLPGILDRLAPIDYAFIDGHHDPAAMQKYLQLLLPHLADNAVLVLDDIVWTSGMRRAWRTFIDDTRLTATADLITFGIACFRKT